MATYQITINEKEATGKKLLAFLKSIPQVVSFDMPKKKEAKKSWLYYELEGAFNDVRLMREGKIKEKTIDEFLEELRKERENELQDSVKLIVL